MKNVGPSFLKPIKISLLFEKEKHFFYMNSINMLLNHVQSFFVSWYFLNRFFDLMGFLPPEKIAQKRRINFNRSTSLKKGTLYFSCSSRDLEFFLFTIEIFHCKVNRKDAI